MPDGDTLTGTGGTDRIGGLAGSDLIRGLGGRDILTGGDGADSFAGTVAEHAGDGITDLAGVTMDVGSPNLRLAIARRPAAAPTWWR